MDKRRTLRREAQAWARLFSLPPVGFSTHKEAAIEHITQTGTMIAFLGGSAGQQYPLRRSPLGALAPSEYASPRELRLQP